MIAVTEMFNVDEMTVDQCRSAAQQLLDTTEGDLTGEAAQRFEQLSERVALLREQEARRVATRRDIVQLFASGNSEGGSTGQRTLASDYDRDPVAEPRSAENLRKYRNPWNMSEARLWGRAPHEVAAEFRGRALSAIESMPGASDNVRAAATSIIEQFDDRDSRLAQHALITSSPEYVRAWSKMARGEMHLIQPEEAAAVEQSKALARAMSLTDSAGGYLVPFQLDPTVIVTSDGVRNDIRQAARVVVATGDVWNGVSSGNVSWSFDPEASEVSDDSPTFAQPSIPNYTARGFVPISFEALQDEQNVTAEVAKLLAGGKNDLEATKFILGSGTGEPTGIVTALTGTSSVVNATADDAFAIGDVYKLQGALPARYRLNASWLANNLTYNLIRGFDQYGGGGFWTNLNTDRPPQLLGRNALEAEAMDGTITTSGSVHNYVLIFGELSNFVITDRLGMVVELIPHLFGANRRPSGQRGWLAWYRTGSDSVNDGGLRMLDVVSAS